LILDQATWVNIDAPGISPHTYLPPRQTLTLPHARFHALERLWFGRFPAFPHHASKTVAGLLRFADRFGNYRLFGLNTGFLYVCRERRLPLRCRSAGTFMRGLRQPRLAA
jgi:hypothetical protein